MIILRYDGRHSMHYLMNKDRIIAVFDFVQNELGTAVSQLVSGNLPEIYADMKLKSWLETRRSAKHRAEITRLLRSLGMTDFKNFIDVSIGLTLTDTFNDRLRIIFFTRQSVKINKTTAFLWTIPRIKGGIR